MKKLLYLFLVLGLFACSSESADDNINSNNSNLESEFKGLWSGSFSGQDNGTWTLTVQNTGIVVGSFTSKDHNEIYSFSGSVDENGGIQASIILENVVGSFVGNLNNNLGSGSYSVNNRDGDFQGRLSTDDESRIINHWNYYSDEITEESTNESGFTALPAGYRYTSNGSYYGMGYGGYFWSSSESNSGNAWHRDLGYDYSNVYRYSNLKRLGFSIRCLGD